MTISRMIWRFFPASALFSVAVPTRPFTLKARLCHRFFPFLPFVLLSFSASLCAQQPEGHALMQGAGSNWERVKALPVNTKLHVATDHGVKTCRVFTVAEDTLTCAKRNNSAGVILPRAEIRHIKLAHYGRSTLVGAAIGGGVGATAGAIGGRTKPCPAAQGFCLNGLGVGAGGVAAIFGVADGILGSAVGGLSDMTRGSSIYTRP